MFIFYYFYVVLFVLGLLIGGFCVYFLIKVKRRKRRKEEEKRRSEEEKRVIREGRRKRKEEQKQNKQTKIEESFIKELKSIGSKFDQKIHNSKKVHDLDYWYNFIQTRAKNDTNKFTQTSPNVMVDAGQQGSLEDIAKIQPEKQAYYQKVAELIWGHADEYNKRLNDPNGDPYNSGYKFDDDEKIDFIKERIIAYGLIHKYLSNLNSEISSVMVKYELYNPVLEIVRLELAHAKGAVYGAIKYAKNIGVSTSNISEWYPDFINDEKLIAGENPFDNLLKKVDEDEYSSETEKRIREHQGWSKEEYNEKLQELARGLGKEMEEDDEN